MKKEIAIKATPHKINKHALCNTAQSISKRTYGNTEQSPPDGFARNLLAVFPYLCEAPFCVHKAEFFDYYLELEE
ncbi:MAG: hypothetical protein ACLS4X_08145 [Ruminococcus callidus]|uniref:hypothetical protein n=1 Tax=Ruminococcus callidus TaxID=40519 RepID=UPI00266CC7DA|nr:hypothetical protein [Ruminococcus callidus]MEE0507195.1 hypothetical protein [Ruminococcus callidus]